MIHPNILQKALALRLGRDLGKRCYAMLFTEWSGPVKSKSKEQVFRWWHLKTRNLLRFKTPTQYIDHQQWQ